MTIDDPTSRPSGDEFRETFDLVDQAIEQITDEHIENQLTKLLATEYGIEPGTPEAEWFTLAEAVGFDQRGLTDFEPTLAYQLELERLRCQIRAAEAELEAAEAQAAAAQHYARRELRNARLLTLKAQEAGRQVNALQDAALQRSQEIIDAANHKAHEMILVAERKAAELVTEAEEAATRTAESGDRLGARDGQTRNVGRVVCVSSTGLVQQWSAVLEGVPLKTDDESECAALSPQGPLFYLPSQSLAELPCDGGESGYAPRHLDELRGLSPSAVMFHQTLVAAQKLLLYCQEDEATALAAAAAEPVPLADQVAEELRARDEVIQDPAETVVLHYGTSDRSGQDRDEPPEKTPYARSSPVRSDCRS